MADIRDVLKEAAIHLGVAEVSKLATKNGVKLSKKPKPEDDCWSKCLSCYYNRYDSHGSQYCAMCSVKCVNAKSTKKTWFREVAP